MYKRQVNIIAILFLVRPALIALRDYEAQRAAGVSRLTFHPGKLGIRGAEDQMWDELSARNKVAE